MLISRVADHKALDEAVLVKLLNGGDALEIKTIVHAHIGCLGIAGDGRLGNGKAAENEAVAEEHINALRAVAIILGLAGILGTEVHEHTLGREALAEGGGA